MHFPRLLVVALGHLTVDLNQGALPAILPFLITAHSLSYAAGAGVVLAANLASTVVQPLFGHLADRLAKPWLIPGGLVLAGAGLAAVGLAPSYGLVLLAAVVSGVGIAAFHPEGARQAAAAAGNRRAAAMSIFGVGGNLGFALGPLLGTAVLLHWGLSGTALLFLPAGLMVLVCLATLSSPAPSQGPSFAVAPGEAPRELPEAWRPFWRVTATAVGRSIIFYGLNTFIPLYWLTVLSQSQAAGGTALALFGAAGVAGNLLGGPLADRVGERRTIVASFLAVGLLLPLFLGVADAVLAAALLVPLGLALSACYSPIVVLGQRYLPYRVGLASGFTIGLSITLGGLVTPLLGKIADLRGIGTALATLILVPFAAAALAATLPPAGKTAEVPMAVPAGKSQEQGGATP